MNGYQTQQRSVILAFFAAHPDEMFTMDEIVRHLKADRGAEAPSRSTVYRAVADLEAEKLLTRNYLTDQRRSAYQYRDGQACDSHLHIRCQRCNRVMHLDGELSQAVSGLLREKARVSLDVRNTTMTGLCEECSEECKEK